MATILDEVLGQIPDSKRLISDSGFEGANIILYTKDKEFFLDNKGVIKKVVDSIKKRIELRPDPSICMDMEKAEKAIKKLIPEEANVNSVIFDVQRSIVIIEAEKPGLAIGKEGELLKEIRKSVLWVPLIRRTPAIESKLIENIRAVLYLNNDYRKKFLDKVGHRIYDGWIRGKKEEWIRVTYLGGAREVGRSCILLQTPESRILLDCGISVGGMNGNMFPYLDAPEFKIDELDAVICSHAHLDHSGLIPWLYKMGYRGPCYMTAPTRDTAALLALDYIGVAFKQAKKSLYDSSDIKEMVKHTICLDYEEVSDITPDVRLTLYNSGHSLGSSMVHLHIGNGLHNALYTSDMKYLRTQLLEPAVINFPRLETLMIESTYGGKDNVLKSRKDSEEQLIKIVKDTIANKGKVLIPVLGVGRSQEVLLILEKAVREGKLEKIPVFVQGMVWDVTAIHTAYPDFLNRNVRKAIFHKDNNPFLSDIFKRVASSKEQKEVLEETGSCVILATAGMLNAGASVEYFKELAGYSKNSIIFVCYQAEGTLGCRVQNGEKHIQINNGGKPEIVEIKMNVHSIPALSGHADRNELIRFCYGLNPKPKKIIVNHGESSRCLDLASSLHKLNRVETNAPKNLESIRIR